ncbi:MAG: polysaccharide deacetylase family protein [Chloroflexales bacterium]|nr:polysaccharide deacetylase family protein [Chloroflexales bacterium]
MIVQLLVAAGLGALLTTFVAQFIRPDASAEVMPPALSTLPAATVEPTELLLLPEPSIPPATPPLVTATPLPLRLAVYQMDYVPILMYHYIRNVNAREDPLGYRLSVTPERFEEQMVWLRDNDYMPIRMGMLADCLRGLKDCPDNPVLITFDDGYKDSATAALPILEQFGFPATFYIVTDFVGKPGYMAWEQIERLRDSDMEIGSHSVSHADLAVVDLRTARREIALSRVILERRLGVPVRSFSYPAGSYTPVVAAMVHQAGYTSAVTTSPLTGFKHMYQLQRRRVLGGETIKGFPSYMTPVQLEEAIGP